MKYIYAFDDKTVLTLLNVGLSGVEMWKLEKLHGKCKSIESEEIE